MYRIGEFSYLCNTSLKTLRYYHNIGLLKPTKVDPFTGYRYYNKNQVKEFIIIKRLQETGFSLDEIKTILKEGLDSVQLEKQIIKIQNESNKKINYLKKLVAETKTDSKKSNTVEFIPNSERYFLGKYFELENRNNADKLISIEKYKDYPKVFINYEKGYKDSQISCFMGYMISPLEIKEIDRKSLEKDGFMILYNNSYQEKSVLHATVMNSIVETYQDIIRFAEQNKIQIRGGFYEIESNNKIDIFIEAYDLTVENQDVIKHNKKLEKNLKNIHPKELIGTWELQGEIIELSKFFNINKKHTMPDTELVKLELLEDGSTNFRHITWKENYLIVQDEKTIIYDPMYNNNGKYLEILINCKYSNARPYTFYYKKVQ